MSNSPNASPSCGSSLPSSSTIFTWRPGTGRPAVSSTSSCRSKSHSSMCGCSTPTAATGLVSVMPHPCTTRTPRCSQYHFVMARGTADPPHRKARMEERSASGCSIR